MTVAEAKPVAEEDKTTDDDVVHVYCWCDPKFLLCGGYDEDDTYEDDEGPVCEDCAAAVVCYRCGCNQYGRSFCLACIRGMERYGY